MISTMVQSAMMRSCIGLLLLATLMGCVKRTLTITSDPPNALVWLNDREVGRTPVRIEFLYYGEYDVRIQHGERETLLTSRWIPAPWWDAPFVDIAAEVLPLQLESSPVWHFALQPRNDNPEQLVDRANLFRSREVGDQQ